MAVVLVTGGTGTLGRHLVPLLRRAGHTVRVMSRRAGNDLAQADLRTGEGLAAAVEGVDAVVHAATDPLRRRRVDEQGTERLLATLGQRALTHFVYVSIVGVDRHALGYYRSKRAAEVQVEQPALPWTILRATQFHELFDRVYRSVPVLGAPTGFRFQPVAAAHAAEHLVEVVANDPRRAIVEVGGPEVITTRALATAWKRARSSRKPVVPVPFPGRAAGDFRRGVHLTPDNASGPTWGDWLRPSAG